MDILQLHEATPGNITDIISLLSESYSQFRQVLTPENWATLEGNLKDRDRITALLTGTDTFVAWIDGRMAGVVFLVPSGNPTHIYPSDWSYIRLLGVTRAARGKGIGRKLMAAAVEKARRNNEKILGLHTSTMMTEARRLYEQMGFVSERELEPVYGQQYWLYCMHL